MKLNENIREVREKRGISIDELAERLKIDAETVEKWESGESQPDAFQLKDLAIELNTTVDKLLREKDKSETYYPLAHHASEPKLVSIAVLIVSSLIFIYAMNNISYVVSIPELNYYKKETEYSAVLTAVLMAVLVIVSIIRLIKESGRPEVLVEYNDYGLRINDRKSSKTVSYEDIRSIETVFARNRYSILKYGKLLIHAAGSPVIEVASVDELEEAKERILARKEENTY